MIICNISFSDMSLLRVTAHVAFVLTLCCPHSSNSLLAKAGLCQGLHLFVLLHFIDIKVSSAQICIQKDKSRDLQLLFPSVRLYLTLLRAHTSHWTNIAALYVVVAVNSCKRKSFKFEVIHFSYKSFYY